MRIKKVETFRFRLFYFLQQRGDDAHAGADELSHKRVVFEKLCVRALLVNAIYQKVMAGESCTVEEAEKYQTYILIHLGKQYHRLGIAMQIHYNCLRGVNRKMNALLGPDTGFDMINTTTCGGQIASLLSALNDTDECPQDRIQSESDCRYIAGSCNGTDPCG